MGYLFLEEAGPGCRFIVKLFLSIILAITLVSMFVSTYYVDFTVLPSCLPCPDNCKFEIVESIPENLTYSKDSIQFRSTFDAWSQMLSNTKQTLDIAEFYWTLKNSDVTPVHVASAWQGELIFKLLMEAGKEKGVSIRITQNAPSRFSPQTDTHELQKAKAAEVRSVEFERLIGAGVLHTKLWIADKKHFYAGSANADWRSLTQVKETGIFVKDCPCLAEDVTKIFEIYWLLGEPNSQIPSFWPKSFSPLCNSKRQRQVLINNRKANVYVSSSPLSFNPFKRTNDIDAILNIINHSKKYVYIAVMDYFPRFLYGKKKKYWPMIDSCLRRAAYERGVEVRLLVSFWKHSRTDLTMWLKSLQSLSGIRSDVIIKTKLFVVPSYNEEQREIPFARVNHNKYMVTDNTAYIGTSNWSGDYFTNTAGVGIAVNESLSHDNTVSNATVSHTNDTIRAQLQKLFERDWNSAYAKDVDKVEHLTTQTNDILNDYMHS